MIAKLLLTGACLLMVTWCHAQFSISGTIRDGVTHHPMPGATIQVDGAKRSALADEFGKYKVENLAAGSYGLIIRFVGYADKSEIMEVQADVVFDIMLEEKSILTDEVVVRATRADEYTPTTFVNVGRQTLQKQNFGQDLPLLLNWTPSVVTTSDAGTGVGYTGIRIRGSDATRVNVTINGIPYNDSESQSTFWVDIPDIASSTQSVQIQRGVGTSSNGAGAFGASINLQTNVLQSDPYAELITAVGSFATQRYTVRAGTGLLNDRWTVDAKASRITSDGYVDRARSELASYYLSAGYYGKKTIVKAISFGGQEKTYQAWYGVDEATLLANRQMNFAGAIYDANGNISRYYDNQVDDYKQDHFQLHASHQFSQRWSGSLSFHYTYGRGFFEEYQQFRSFASVGLPDVVIRDTTITNSDMIVRKWLDNRFYGGTYGIHYQGEKSTFILGGAYHRYGDAKHFGEIIWSEYAGQIPIRYKYYEGESEKNDFNAFAKWTYQITNALSTFVDMQYRQLRYTTTGIRDDQTYYAVDDRFYFFNPKAGASFTWSEKNLLYVSYAITNREPNRSDYLEGTGKPRPERLSNLEFGLRRNTSRYAVDINYYLMNYTDQLVQTGAIDNAGFPIRANVGKSYRTGLELSGTIRLSDRWTWNANATWSINQNIDYVIVENNTTVTRNTSIILSPGIIAGSQLTWKPFANADITWLSKYVGKQFLDNSESKAVKLPAYLINDLRLNYQFTPKGLREIGLSVLINNLLNETYASNGYSYGGVPYYFPQAGRNFMAMITLKL